jgi:thiol-disulfide isomerase/thioredoxin
MRIRIFAILMVLLGADVASPRRSTAAESREVRGRVVDEMGAPVASADVSYTWRANGPCYDDNGKLIKRTDGTLKEFWAHVGDMAPSGVKPAKTGRDGRFVLSVHPSFFFVMAMDKSRQRGGLVFLPPENGPAEIEIRLGPLIRVKGSLEGPRPGERPSWTNVYTLVPDDPARPLAVTRLVGCDSNEARFAMSLPPGRYFLDAYRFNGDDTDQISEIDPPKEILLTTKSPSIDLGVLRLPAFKFTTQGLKNRAKAAGRWNDYTKHYGERVPHWYAVDGRGVKKEAQAADFKGKWLLVDFWGLSCAPCLSRSIPTLIKFYDDHAQERDRFEILSICIDHEGDIKSIADLDRKLQPIIDHVWHKALPFPILLDPTFTTWERFGLPGLGTVILIDPDGHLVKGDETLLAEKLKQR